MTNATAQTAEPLHKAKAIHTSIDIQAPAETVWAILMDREALAEWNPFVLKWEGDIALGAKQTVVLHMPDKDYTFTPRIVHLTEGAKLAWLGRMFVKGLFDGRHSYEVMPTGANSCTFVQSERFSGLFAGMILKNVGADTLAGFKAMNAALKARAERVVQ